MLRETDRPYLQALMKIQGDRVTSDQIDRVVYNVNANTGLYYDGGDVIRIMQFCDLINIQSHLGQPRHGNLINGGRLHKFTIYGG